MNRACKIPVNKQSTMHASRSSADTFPAGLRVLLVDDDLTCLMVLERTLRKCDYEVTKCNSGEDALSLLRENKNGFDVVISDVHMPDMDGFKLLVHIGLEMDLPVIMMSADDSPNVVMKGVTHGACDYLIKPVRIESLRNIWQHVVRKRKYEWKDIEPSANLDEGDQQQNQPADPEYSPSANEGRNCTNIKRRKDEEDETEEIDDSSFMKKPRVTWTHELHQRFLAAVIQLGSDNAVPRKILGAMNVPGITREHVGSHLQKYWRYLNRLKDRMKNSVMDNQDAGHGSFSGQATQLPAQRLATLQAAALSRSGNSKSPVLPLVVQTNTFFTFDTPKLRYGNQPGNTSNISKQMSFPHGIPTTMEQQRLARLQRSFMGMHNRQAPNPMSSHSLSQTQNHALKTPILPMLAASQASSNRNESTRNGLGIPPIMSTSTLQQQRSIEATNSIQGFVSSDGVLKNVNQNRTHGSAFDPFRQRNYMQGGLNVPPQHTYYALGQKIMGSQVTFSAGESSGSSIADIPSKTIVEGVNYGTSHQRTYPLEHSQNDLLTAILTQQKEQKGIGDAKNEHAHNSDSSSNLPK